MSSQDAVADETGSNEQQDDKNRFQRVSPHDVICEIVGGLAEVSFVHDGSPST